MHRDSFTLFPSIGIPLFLEEWLDEPLISTALLFRAFDEAIRLSTLCEVARAAGAGLDKADELRGLRLMEPRDMLDLALSLRQEVVHDFPSLIPEGEDWLTEAIGWLDRRDTFLETGRVEDEWLGDRPFLRDLARRFAPGPELDFFAVHRKHAFRLHPFHSITGRLPFAFGAEEDGAVMARHRHGKTLLRLDPFYLEHGGAVFGHLLGLDRVVGLDAASGLLHFTSRSFSPRPEPFTVEASVFDGLAGALYDGRYEYLGPKDGRALVVGAESGALHWVVAPGDPVALRAMEKQIKDPREHLMRFTPLEAGERYEQPVFVSEPLRVPALTPLFQWKPPLPLHHLRNVLKGVVSLMEQARADDRDVGAISPEHIAQGADGRWKWIPPHPRRRWNEEAAMAAFSRLVQALPEHELVTELRADPPTSLAALAKEMTAWIELADATEPDLDHELARLRQLHVEAIPVRPSSQARDLLAAIDADDAKAAKPLLDAAVRGVGEVPMASVFLGVKGALLRQEDDEAGMEALEAAHRLCDRNLAVCMALVEHYEQLPNDEKVLALLRRRLELVQGHEETRLTLEQLARLCDERLDRPDEALGYAERLVTLAGETLENVRLRQGLARRAGDERRATELAERELVLLAPEDVERRIELLRQITRYHGQGGQDFERARRFGLALMEETPGDIETLRLMAQTIPPGDTSEDALRVFEALDEQRDFLEAREADGVLLRLGRVLRERNAPYEKVVRVLEDVLARSPGDTGARHELVRLERDAGRVAEAIEHLKKLVALDVDPSVRAEHLCALGRMYFQLDDPRAGLAQLLEAFQITPTDDELFDELVQLAGRGPHLQELARAHRLRTEATEDGPRAIQRRLAWLHVEEARGAPVDDLIAILIDGLERDAGQRVFWIELERIALRDGQAERFVVVVEELLDVCIEAFGQEYVLKAAILAETALDDAERAAALLAELLERHVIGRSGLVRLLRLFASAGEDDKAEQVLEHLLSGSDAVSERVALYQMLARDLARHEETIPVAISYYNRVLSLDERADAAFDALRRLHETREDWNALLDVLEKESAAFPELRPQLAIQIANLLESRLDRVKEAIDIYLEEVREGRGGAEALQHLLDREMSEEEWRNIANAIRETASRTSSWEVRRGYLENLAFIEESILRDPAAASDVLIDWYAFEPDNEGLLNRIVQLLLESDRWLDVIHFYRNYLSFTVDPAERVVVLEKMAEIYLVSMSNPLAAIKLFKEAQAIADKAECIRILQRVREITIENELWEQAIENLDDQLSYEVLGQVELLHTERGALFAERLGDLDAAVGAYDAALAANPAHLPALQGKLSVLMDRGVWKEAVNLLDQIVALLDDAALRVQHRVQAAEIARARLGDDARAADLYAAAVAEAPEQHTIYAPLMELHVQMRRWSEADALGQTVLAYLKDVEDQEERVRLLQLIGRVAEELRKDDVAVMVYEQAQAIAGDSVEIELGLAFAYERLGRDADALGLFKQLMSHKADQLPKASLPVVKGKVEALGLKLGSTRTRAEILEAAVEARPDDLEVLRELIALLREDEQWEKAVAYSLTLARKTPFDEEESSLLLAAAELYADRLDMPDAAVEHFEEVLARRTDEAAAYIKLLEIYLEREAFQDAIELLERFVANDPDEMRRASVLYTLGVLVRDHTTQLPRALECFNRSLDLDPNRLEAFTAIEEIVTRLGDAEAQVESYQRMIQRIRGRGKSGLEYKLFLNLGKLFLTVVHDHERAATAFEQASALKPDEVEPLEYQVELAVDDDMKAVIHEKTVQIKPSRKASLRFLRGYHTRRKAYDRVWNICAVTSMLGVANDMEEQFYEAYKPQGVRIKRRALADDVREKLLYRPASIHGLQTGHLLSQIDALIGASLQRQVNELSFPIDGPLTVEGYPNLHALSELIRGILGLDAVPIMTSGEGFFTQKVRLEEPTLVLGQRLLSEPDIKKACFSLARAMASFRPECRVWRIYPVAQIRNLLLAALKAQNPGLKVSAEQEAPVQALARVIHQHDDDDDKQQLTRMVNRFMEASAKIDIRGWARDTELNMNRFGLLVANDVRAAVRVLKDEGIYSERLSPEEAVRDLLAYQLSPAFSRLKEEMGCAVKIERS